jgi:hypothetical protein|tara:strand:- start:554 stop:679 length:126 start_codon:yes stop_codon:yes gene_type:complete
VSKNLLEKTTLVFAAVVVLSATWFWIAQIQAARELLRMAYG